MTALVCSPYFIVSALFDFFLLPRLKRGIKCKRFSIEEEGAKTEMISRMFLNKGGKCVLISREQFDG